MSVNVDPAGRRYVRVEVEVEGSPEDVWNAIATGPGVSSWFVPAKFDLDADGRPNKLVCHFGEGMDSHARVTGWEPPARFTAESDDFAPGGPVVATEWNVKPVRKETCLVTVEHSLCSGTDEWDTFLENTESGWPAFFTVLRIRMAHFRNQPFAILEVVGKAAEPNSAWADLATSLGIANPSASEHRSSPPDSPSLAGIVESVPSESEVLLRLERPAPGVGHLFALPMGEEVYLSIRLYLYGTEATTIVKREQPVWWNWMEEYIWRPLLTHANSRYPGEEFPLHSE